MPLWDVQCTKCQKVREVYFKKESELREEFLCECGGKEFQKMPARFNFKLKGDGWTPKFNNKEKK